ncbi:MAG: IS630 family transposase [Spirulina sp.]
MEKLARETKKLLWRIYRESESYQVRRRAHGVLLRYEGWSISQIASIFNVSERIVSYWWKEWKERKLVSLYARKGKGRKPLLNDEQKEQVKKWAKQTPRNLKKVLEKIQEEWGINMSKQTLKRALKCLKMTWKRMRKDVANPPEPEEYKRKKEELENLKEQERQGKIEIRYLDEVGFCLEPYIPYAWQERGETLFMKSQKSRRFNILGLLGKSNQLDSYLWNCSIDSEIVVACIDDFCKRVTKKTFIVMDLASIHTSKSLFGKLEEWRSQNLEIFWLPRSSPKLNRAIGYGEETSPSLALNLIEIFWRFIKYQWLKPKDYESLETLKEAVEQILRHFGTDYAINFV